MLLYYNFYLVFKGFSVFLVNLNNRYNLKDLVFFGFLEDLVFIT